MQSLVQFRPRIKSIPVAGPSPKRYPEVQRADQGHCWPRIPVAARSQGSLTIGQHGDGPR